MLEEGQLSDAARRRDRQYAEFLKRVRAFRMSLLAYRASVIRRNAQRPRQAGDTAQIATARRVNLAPPATHQHVNANPGSPPSDKAVRSPLTARQLEIARLIARGYTNQQIAEALVLTPGTVANHVQHILERLGLHSRTQIAVWFTRSGALLPSTTARRGGP